jgi:predicted RNase H-like HicB family nuclease
MVTFNVLIEKDEDEYFVSEAVELPGCHTQAKTLDELMKRTKEAVSLYLKCCKKCTVSEKFIGLQQIEV